jgi:hypothetical protein
METEDESAQNINVDFVDFWGCFQCKTGAAYIFTNPAVGGIREPGPPH